MDPGRLFAHRFVSGALGGIVGAILTNNRWLLNEDVARDAVIPPKKHGEVFGSYVPNGFLGRWQVAA